VSVPTSVRSLNHEERFLALKINALLQGQNLSTCTAVLTTLLVGSLQSIHYTREKFIEVALSVWDQLAADRKAKAT
jgi:hypothetical protein